MAGLKDLVKKKLLMKELETVDDEGESASDEEGVSASGEGESASTEIGPDGKPVKKKKTDEAPGFKGKLDANNAVSKSKNPLKLWAKKKSSFVGDSEDG